MTLTSTPLGAEPFSRKRGNLASLEYMRVLLITESDLMAIHKARTIGQGRGHSGGKWNPSGIAYGHGAYSSFRLLRWRQLEKLADLWFAHTERLADHYARIPHPLCNYDGVANDAAGTAIRMSRNQNQSSEEGKSFRKENGAVWYWRPWENGYVEDPHITSFTLLRPTKAV